MGSVVAECGRDRDQRERSELWHPEAQT